jgi:hypothetical protein
VAQYIGALRKEAGFRFRAYDDFFSSSSAASWISFFSPASPKSLNFKIMLAYILVYP